MLTEELLIKTATDMVNKGIAIVLIVWVVMGFGAVLFKKYIK